MIKKNLPLIATKEMLDAVFDLEAGSERGLGYEEIWSTMAQAYNGETQ